MSGARSPPPSSPPAPRPSRRSADVKRLYFNRMAVKGPPDKAPILVMDADGQNEKELTKGDGPDLLGGTPLFLIKRFERAGKP